MVAPMDKPRKIVLVFNIVSDAALDNLTVETPISLIRFPNIKNPINGVAEGTIIDIIKVIKIGKIILRAFMFLIFTELGYSSSCFFILIKISFLETVNLTTIGINTGTNAIYE